MRDDWLLHMVMSSTSCYVQEVHGVREPSPPPTALASLLLWSRRSPRCRASLSMRSSAGSSSKSTCARTLLRTKLACTDISHDRDHLTLYVLSRKIRNATVSIQGLSSGPATLTIIWSRLMPSYTSLILPIMMSNGFVRMQTVEGQCLNLKLNAEEDKMVEASFKKQRL